MKGKVKIKNEGKDRASLSVSLGRLLAPHPSLLHDHGEGIAAKLQIPLSFGHLPLGKGEECQGSSRYSDYGKRMTDHRDSFLFGSYDFLTSFF